MNHARAVVATGMSFPIGVMLGATVGVALGDLIFAVVCFLFVPVPLTLLVFWRTTRDLEWPWKTERAAYLRVFGSAFVGTGIMIAAIWVWTITGIAELVFLALPLCALVVTLRTKSALAGVQ